jgi:hypothetical protein
MQVGIDSFAAAFDDGSRAVSPQERLRNLVEQIEHADQIGLDMFGAWGLRCAARSARLAADWQS